MATSSFDQKFVIKDEEAKDRFLNIYNSEDELEIKDVEAKEKALNEKSKKGIEILRKNLSHSFR